MHTRSILVHLRWSEAPRKCVCCESKEMSFCLEGWRRGGFSASSCPFMENIFILRSCINCNCLEKSHLTNTFGIKLTEEKLKTRREVPDGNKPETHLGN